MPIVKANNIEICYETFGDESNPALLLIGGMGWQLASWNERFCNKLADADFFVVVLDNRDTGLSSKLSELGEPDIPAIFADLSSNRKPTIPYSIDDMATDAIGLMDALNIQQAHVCGASLGGMVVQSMAIHYPERILSITPIGATTNNPELPKGDPDALKVASDKRIDDRVAAGERALNMYRVSGSKGFPMDESSIVENAYRLYDRGFNAEGVQRQMAAAISFTDSRKQLQKLNVKALVIHGSIDPLVRPEHSVDIHQNLPGSELLIIEGMGHDVPEGASEIMATAIKKMAFD